MHRVKEDMSRRPQTALARRLRHEQTDAEKAIWAILRRKQMSGLKFRRQEPIGPYVVDFVSCEKKLVIEIDGGQHAEIQARTRDEARSMWLRSQGYEVLRFWNNDVLADREAVAESIRAALEDSPSPSSSPIEGEETTPSPGGREHEGGGHREFRDHTERSGTWDSP